jgi:Cu+-exporting ATPase
MSEKIILNVSGMTCSSCAEGISRHLKKKGVSNVIVDFEAGKVETETSEDFDTEFIENEIRTLGYGVEENHSEVKTQKFLLNKTEILFSISAILTIPLLLGMIPNFEMLHQPTLQIILSSLVVGIGVYHFGKSAVGSIRTLMPNMDVLILTGSLAAYIYSIASFIIYKGMMMQHVMFFETSATIITLVLLGNIIEQ